MKKCPNCGYLDRSHWRQNRWRTNVEFLKLEYREDIQPKILQQLLDGHPIAVDEDYAYRLSGQIVERILREDYEIGGSKAFHIPREKPPQKDPWQQELGETR